MSLSLEEACRKFLASGACADTLCELANACRERAKTERPMLTWLGLDSLCRSLGAPMYDRPVTSVETDKLSARLRPLVEVIARSPSDADLIEGHAAELRDLL